MFRVNQLTTGLDSVRSHLDDIPNDKGYVENSWNTTRTGDLTCY